MKLSELAEGMIVRHPTLGVGVIKKVNTQLGPAFIPWVIWVHQDPETQQEVVEVEDKDHVLSWELKNEEYLP